MVYVIFHGSEPQNRHMIFLVELNRVPPTLVPSVVPSENRKGIVVGMNHNMWVPGFSQHGAIFIHSSNDLDENSNIAEVYFGI